MFSEAFTQVFACTIGYISRQGGDRLLDSKLLKGYASSPQSLPRRFTLRFGLVGVPQNEMFFRCLHLLWTSR